MDRQLASDHVNASDFGDGNQAIAWAAEDSSVGYVAHYPGAPVSRVAGLFSSAKAIHFNHAHNEHVAALAALGASLCGVRSLVVMKHVGLNIAADPLNYAGVVKITGGMVVLVGTDPGARASTGEEDVHWYAPQFNLPLFEPTGVQGLYDAVAQAYALSEQVRLPVLVFVPGRIANQSSVVLRTRPAVAPRLPRFDKNPQALINVGPRAVANHREQLARLAGLALQASPATARFNSAADVGLVTRGATFAVTCEAVVDLQLEKRVQLLNVERTFPLHREQLVTFAAGKRKIVVVEDQDGFLETMLKRELLGRIACPVEGKEHFPGWGEIGYQQVADYLAGEFVLPQPARPALLAVESLPERPGACCEGCPHRSALFAIEQVMQGEDGIVGGDIGCSSLPPHRTDWLLCMNAGIGLSQGIAQVLPQRALVSTGGDGSLFHGGLLALHSAVENGIALTHVLLDNQSVAMTGHQPSPTTTGRFDMRGLLRASGVKHVIEVSAFAPSLIIRALHRAKTLDGVKVVWVRGECALQRERRTGRRRVELWIDRRRCGDCTLCYRDFQCPAIVLVAETGACSIDPHRCRRCGACLDLCPHRAIMVTRWAPAAVARLLSTTRAWRRLTFRGERR